MPALLSLDMTSPICEGFIMSKNIDWLVLTPSRLDIALRRSSGLFAVCRMQRLHDHRHVCRGRAGGHAWRAHAVLRGPTRPHGATSELLLPGTERALLAHQRTGLDRVQSARRPMAV